MHNYFVSFLLLCSVAVEASHLSSSSRPVCLTKRLAKYGYLSTVPDAQAWCSQMYPTAAVTSSFTTTITTGTITDTETATTHSLTTRTQLSSLVVATSTITITTTRTSTEDSLISATVTNTVPLQNSHSGIAIITPPPTTLSTIVVKRAATPATEPAIAPRKKPGKDRDSEFERHDQINIPFFWAHQVCSCITTRRTTSVTETRVPSFGANVVYVTVTDTATLTDAVTSTIVTTVTSTSTSTAEEVVTTIHSRTITVTATATAAGAAGR